MRKSILKIVMVTLMTFSASGAWAQDAPLPADTPAAETPVTIPAPEVNVAPPSVNVAPAPAPNVDVHVDAPAAAPPASVIIDRQEPSTSTTTNITRSETHVVQQPVEAGFNPWLAVGIGLAVLIVLLFVAMAAGDRRSDTVLTGTGRTVTTVQH